MEKRHIQLLFDRPAEPITSLKGNEGVQFNVPSEYLTDRYQSIGASLTNRFGEDVAESVDVTKIDNINLAGAETLSRDESFSIFIPRHRRIARDLMDVFLDAPDLNSLLSTCTFAKDRVNAGLFNYCLSVALLHRPDSRDIRIPSLVETFPDRFISSSVFQQTREEASVVPTQFRQPIEIPRDYTASDLDPEHRVAYWREDIGLNLHHWHWHLVYPFEGRDEVVRKDRRGELFYYMHEQIQARYNFERLANSLPRVKKLNNFRDPIPEGYYSKLDTIIASRGWAPRQENMVMQDLSRPNEEIAMSLTDFQVYINRLFDVIHTGNYITPTGETVPLGDTTNENIGIDILGDLIEATSLSRNPTYYGNVHNFGHLFLGYIHDPEGKYLERAGVMADPATDLRDPIFFRWHAFIDDMFQEYKGSLRRYSRAQLSNPNITVSNVDLIVENGTNDVFETFWMKSDLDVSRGLDFVRGGRVLVRHTHLNHKPFTYRISYNNGGEAKMGTVRIFLAPTNDERGIPWVLREQRLMFIELDKFFVMLNSGANEIIRRSDESSVTIPFERTFRNLEAGGPTPTDDAFNFCGCGWPQHVLIPRGTESGMPCQLFVMISNAANEMIDQGDMAGVCEDAASYCGIRGKLYPDRRSMGFPFDRLPNANITSINDFLTPNMSLKNVTIRYSNTTVDNPLNPGPQQ